MSGSSTIVPGFIHRHGALSCLNLPPVSSRGLLERKQGRAKEKGGRKKEGGRSGEATLGTKFHHNTLHVFLFSFLRAVFFLSFSAPSEGASKRSNQTQLSFSRSCENE
jgi:hypothetical protein